MPFAAYNLISIVFNLMLSIVRGTDYSVMNSLIGMFVQMRRTKYTSYCWFLAWLLVAQMIFYWIVKLNYKRGVLCFLLAILGCYCSYKNIVLPWQLDAALVAMPFLLVGSYIKLYGIENLKKYKIIFWVAWGASFGFNYVLLGYHKLDIYESSLGNPILFYLSGICGSCIIMLTMNSSQDSACMSFLALLGRHSLVLYGLHSIINVITWQILSKIMGLTSGNGIIEIIRAFLMLSVNIIVIIPIGKFMENYFPRLFGYKKSEKM